MPVTNPTELDAYANIANNAYNNTENDPETNPFSFSEQDGGVYEEIFNVINGPFGFQARAFFNTTKGELVVSFAGTEGLRDGLNTQTPSELPPDLLAGFGLARCWHFTSRRTG